MKKIPCMFERYGTPYRATNIVAVDVTGAIPTVKVDGACCMVKNRILYKRRLIKAGKPIPIDFVLVETRPDNGKQLGWVPVIEGNSDHKYYLVPSIPIKDGTYELLGEKVQGGIYGDEYRFEKHGSKRLTNAPSGFDELYAYLVENYLEGIVWWKDGEPIAKIKRVDFGIPWPTRKV